ncbi:MAG: hypothetical protein RL026_1620, partial [Pseudomonadota bacterium]
MKRIERGVATAVALALSMQVAGAMESGEAEAALEEVAITGSRIAVQTGMTTPTPVTAVTAAEISQAAPGAMVEALTQLPQFFGSTTLASQASSGGFFVSPGAGNLNLRGLGTNRTLVLLDGRRLAPSSRFGGTDINVLPESIIRSVETVTGGASAAYGTDAVAGVVNFLLDTDFTGFKGHLQGGQTSREDNRNFEASFAAGFDLGERGHLLLAGEKHAQDGVFTYKDRDWYQGWGLVSAAGNNNLQLVRPGVVSTRLSLDGIIINQPAGSPLANTQFLPNGQWAPFTYGDPAATAAGTTFTHSVVGGGSGTDNNADRPNVMPETSRDNIFVYADLDATDNLTLFAQGVYGRSDFRVTNYGGAFGSVHQLTIFQDNAYLPQALRDAMVANNIPSFNLGRVGALDDLARDTWLSTESTMKSGTAGFKGEFTGDHFLGGWRYNGYAQYGDTKTNAAQIGGLR